MAALGTCPVAPLHTVSESFVLMGTVVSIRLVGRGGREEEAAATRRALAAMREVEETLSRFDPESELSRLCQRPGEVVPVSPLLFYALKMARGAAEATEGAFDPTVGGAMEAAGFNRHYLTGEEVVSRGTEAFATYRDIHLIEDDCSVHLDRPMVLDLGAVAKGLAVDLAARALDGFEGYAVDAGGDVYVGGVDPDGNRWTVGIEDPVEPARIRGRITLTNLAICTSGNYRRRSPKNPTHHHLYNPRTKRSAEGFLALTVVAPLAVLADVSATAGFVLGPEQGMAWLETQELAAAGVTADGRMVHTPAMAEYWR